MKSVWPISIVALLLNGCSMFTPPLEKPVIEEKLNRGFIDDSSAVGTLSLTPERRVVLVSFQNNRFCAEAPTEVGQDISKLVQAAANASDTTGQTIGLGALIAGNYSNSVLNKRSQGVQLFLANAYFLCQMYMNNAITGAQLLEAQVQLLNAVGPIITQELPLLYAQEQDARTTFQQLDFSAILNAGENEKEGDGPTPEPQEGGSQEQE